MPINKTLQLFSAFLILSFNLWGQSPSSHQPAIFVDSTGQVYVMAGAPAYFFISPADSSSKPELIPSSDKAANPMHWDGEGSHYLVQRNENGTANFKFRILADGTAPVSEIIFSEGLVFIYENTFFAETGFKANIVSKDAMSGAKESYVSINNESFQLLNDEITIDKQGNFPIKFYSIDNVGNVEEFNEFSIITTSDALVRMDNIYFELNSTKLTSSSKQALNKLASILKEFPDIHMEIRAHSDSRGNSKYNLLLSEQRAQVTVSYLISRGVPKERLSSKGYGDSMLLNECAKGVQCSEEKHMQNRRVEFMISKMKNESNKENSNEF